MTTLKIGDTQVEVDDAFLKMTPEQQSHAVAEIAATMGTHGADSAPAQESPAQWSDLPGNIMPSAGKFAGDMANAIAHPVQTGEALDNAVAGGIANANDWLYGHLPDAISGPLRSFDDAVAPYMPFSAIQKQAVPEQRQQAQQVANAIGGAMRERYGSGEAFKRTMIQDPVGFLADASTVLSGGTGLTARAPLLSSKLATASRLTDPLFIAGKMLKPVAKGAGYALHSGLGVTTGAGREAVATAYRSGRQGRDAGQAFRENIRGKVSPESLLRDAESAMGNLADNRRNEYLQNMQATRASGATVNLAPIKQKLEDLDASMQITPGPGGSNTAAFGSLSKASKSEAALLDEIGNLVAAWDAHPQGNSPIALDALRQRISKLGPDPFSPTGANEKRMVAQMTDAIEAAISQVEPTYSQALKGYSEAKDLEREIGQSFSMTGRGNPDVALSKFQRTFAPGAGLRNPRRVKALHELERAGAPNLGNKISGQQLSGITPKGLTAKALVSGLFGTSIYNPSAWPVAGLALASSPRLVGETVHGMGRLARRTPKPTTRAIIRAAIAGRAYPYAGKK